MKKFLGLLVFALLLSGCDDGDMVLESFNFGTATIQKCPDKQLLFKTSNEELLLVNIPASSFPNAATPAGQPTIVTISGSNSVLYRKYNGAVTGGTICSVVPPSSPSVLKEWTAAQGGKIQITSTERTATDPVTNVTTVVGHNHQIKFINIQFVSSDNTFVFEEYLFGTYQTSI
ncbi:hypothetical protein LZZ90_10460 [Flavobacterium sp. SM15]|uniref:hypothetical protein n=1 Tax=Flavobacterium sp. SM15 TaxID=2908005 RepID=UPI001EDB63CF|nr:hypothetical protein [Flavobacterium sp. SM15]MCG2611928.1 hypothetical protein [Flavobacterium sp. SM15]